jgi:hypothetical protein
MNLKCSWVKFGIIGFFCLASILLPVLSIAGEVEFVPGIALLTEYNDNIDLVEDSGDAIDDFAGSAIPGARLNYKTERFNLNSRAQLDFKKYLDNTDFDRTNQLYEVDAQYQAFERWTFSGGYSFRRDETVDSQLEETGRVFERKRVQRHDANGGVRFALTELSDIGSFASYRRADYSGRDNTDYDRYTLWLPYSKRFQNQLDTIRITPAYSHYNSDDNEEADDFRLTFGWESLISETLTFDMSVGGRYTTVKEENGDENSNFGGVGDIGLAKRAETFNGEIRYSRDLRSTTEGEIINVDRLYLFANKRITERFGIRFRGNAYHSNRENNDAPNDKVITFEVEPALYYMLTENHFVELNYSYFNQRELDEPGNPVTQRNRVWLGLVFNFPQKWD